MKSFFQMLFLLSLTAITFSFIDPIFAQNNSSDKPYQQWTISDVEKLLNDSPWAQTKSKGSAVGYNNPIITSGYVPTPESVTLRLRSATPVRQAILRFRQIKAKYDKMSEDDKRTFDAKQKDLIECPACADNYVVTLSPPFGQSRGLPAGLKSIPFASLKLYVQLANEKAEKRELVHFVAPKNQVDDAVFFFPRFNEKGEPLVTATSKKIIIFLDPKIFGANPVTIVKFEFDVSKMTRNGELMF